MLPGAGDCGQAAFARQSGTCLEQRYVRRAAPDLLGHARVARGRRQRREVGHVTRSAIARIAAAVGLAAVLPTALPPASTSASAEQRTLTVAGYGGSFEQTLRKSVFPAFEAKHGVRIDYVAGNSTDTLAKLQAQKGNQVIDVAIVDDGPMYQAIQLGFCAPIAGLNAADLYQAARFKGDQAVAIGQNATGLMINTKYFKDKGWPPPRSWNDLKDPKYRKLLVIPPINNTYGLYTLVMFARMNGGGEARIDPGFTVMTEEVNPNVLVYEPSPGKMTELFQSSQAVIAVWGTGRVQAFANSGFPVDFIYPEEGAPILLASACPVAKPHVDPLSHAFINTLLGLEAQTAFAKDGNGPVNNKVDPAMPELAMAPVGERAQHVLALDWDAINANREAWTKRWNREVER
jgi:putative spermidine/putrescine transport system substrate-binding protein